MDSLTQCTHGAVRNADDTVADLELHIEDLGSFEALTMSNEPSESIEYYTASASAVPGCA